MESTMTMCRGPPDHTQRPHQARMLNPAVMAGHVTKRDDTNKKKKKCAVRESHGAPVVYSNSVQRVLYGPPSTKQAGGYTQQAAPQPFIPVLYLVGFHPGTNKFTERVGVDMWVAHSHSPVLQDKTGKDPMSNNIINTFTIKHAEVITLQLLIRYFLTGSLEWSLHEHDDNMYTRPLLDRHDHWIRLWVIADQLRCRDLQKLLIPRMSDAFKLQETQLERRGLVMNRREKLYWDAMGEILLRTAVCASWIVKKEMGCDTEAVLSALPRHFWSTIRDSTKEELLELLDAYLFIVSAQPFTLGIMQRFEMEKFVFL